MVSTQKKRLKTSEKDETGKEYQKEKLPVNFYKRDGAGTAHFQAWSQFSSSSSSILCRPEYWHIPVMKVDSDGGKKTKVNT